MTRDEIFAKVVEIVKPYVKNEEALVAVTDDTNILEDLKVNSARLVDIILNFEDEFDIEVEDEDADAVNTMGDAVRLIQEKLSRASLFDTASVQDPGCPCVPARSGLSVLHGVGPSDRLRPARLDALSHQGRRGSSDAIPGTGEGE